MSQDKEKNKKEKKVTLLSIMATGPACALIGYSLGERWGGTKGGLVGLVVGYGYGIFLHNWVYSKKNERRK